MGRPRKFTDEQEAGIAAQYPAKGTYQLAKIYNTSASTICKIIKRQGSETRSLSESQRRFTDRQEAEIAAQYPAKSTVELAKIYGTSADTIIRVIKRQGGEIRSRSEVQRRKFTDEQGQIICQRYLAGESTVDLAELYNAGVNTITSAIKRQGGKIRSASESRRSFTDEQEAEIAAQYPEKSTYQLAELYNVSDVTIRSALERQGVDRCPVGEFGDSVQHAINGTGYHQHQRECEFYLFELARYSDTHCKPGIAFDIDKRVRLGEGEYGAEVLRLVFATRAEAYFLEQAVLDATRGSAGYPDELIGWIGHTEVRSMPASDMEPIVLRLAEELEDLGVWEFAARYVPMTAAQRAICQQRALQEVAP